MPKPPTPGVKRLLANSVRPAKIDPAATITDAVERLMGAQSDLREAVQFAVYEKGWTWQQVGNSLGISRQAAHERFSRD